MLLDGFKFLQTSTAEGLVIESGSAFPIAPADGQMFKLNTPITDDLGGSYESGIYCWDAHDVQWKLRMRDAVVISTASDTPPTDGSLAPDPTQYAPDAAALLALLGTPIALSASQLDQVIGLASDSQDGLMSSGIYTALVDFFTRSRVEAVNTYADLPAGGADVYLDPASGTNVLGQPAHDDKLFVVKDTNSLYRWDTATQQYVLIGGGGGSGGSGIPMEQKGAVNGVATLDATGKVPAAQLPSYVDDVVEYDSIASFPGYTDINNVTTPGTGETGKIYVSRGTNKTYRWSGSQYVEISASEVTRVNGKVGDVVLTKADVGLSNVLNVAQVQNRRAWPFLARGTYADRDGVAAQLNDTTDVGGFFYCTEDGTSYFWVGAAAGGWKPIGQPANTAIGTDITGTYGSTTSVPQITLNRNGNVVGVSTIAITYPVTSVNGMTGDVNVTASNLPGLTSYVNNILTTGGYTSGGGSGGGTVPSNVVLNKMSWPFIAHGTTADRDNLATTLNNTTDVGGFFWCLDTGASYFWTGTSWKVAGQPSSATTSVAGTYSTNGGTRIPQITLNDAGNVTGVTYTNVASPVTSVNGRTGAVVLSSSDVGLNKVANALQVINKGNWPGLSQGNGAPPALYGDGSAPVTNDFYWDYGSGLCYRYNGTGWVIASQPPSSTLVAGTYGTSVKVPTITVNAAGTVTGVVETPINFPVSSVAGKTGAVTLTSSDVGLGNVDNVKQLPYTQTFALTGDVSVPTTALNAGTFATTLAATGVAAGTYRSVTVDTKGRVLAGTNPSTLAGYGITDAVQNKGNWPWLRSGTDVQRQQMTGLTAADTGGFFFATDTGVSWFWNGSAWKNYGVPAASTLTSGTYGTTTKVAQITVNASGSVTNVVEQPIAFPVTSVNGQFGAVNVTASSIGALTSADIGVANGAASLDASGKVPVAQLPNTVTGALNYQGVWNASTNSPTLQSGVGTKGYYYKVNTAGTTAIDGTSNWYVGDLIAYNGSTWDRIDGGSTEVLSVAGKTGAVTLTATDVGLGNVVNSLQVINKGTWPSLAMGADSAKPASGNTTNDFYWATDTGVSYRWTGTAWQAASQPNGSTLVAGTYGSASAIPVVTVNASGTVTGMSSIAPAWAGISGKPTTISGYGITDALVLTTTTTPLANGTAAIGTSTTAARADHVHPTASAVNVSVADDNASSGSFPLYWSSNGSGTNTVPKVSTTKFYVNPNTGTMFAGAFAGNGASLTNLSANNITVGTIPSTVLGNSTVYIGTTAVPLNRGSSGLAMTGVSIDGNAGTATALQTARTINGVSFNGTSNISINLNNSVTAGSYLTGGSFNGSAAATFAVNAATTNTASTVVARDGSGGFAAGAVAVTSLTVNGNALGSNAYRSYTVSTAAPSGGVNGDVWYMV